MKHSWLVTIGVGLFGAAMVISLFGSLIGSGCVFYLNPQCNDMIRNGDETGLDCGGGTCGPCDIGEGCRKNSDCDDSMCTGGVCTPFPCDNGVKGELETDVDCGGGMCRKCSGGRHCLVDADCFSGKCEPTTSTCFELGSVSFAPRVSYPSGVKTYALFTGDLNGDGILDLVAANEEESTLSVFMNDGHGNFTKLGPSIPTGEYSTGGAIADFNHDGVLDVVTADYHGDSISIYLNTGGGNLAPKVSYPTVPGGETSNLAVGDLDGDGNLDVIATNPTTSSMSRFMGRADGTFADAVTETVGTVGGTLPFSAAIGDFNGDGKPDLALGDEVVGPMIVRLGKGDGTFGPETQYPTGGTGPFYIIAVDLDLDGKLDLVTANRNSSDVSVFMGRGDGTFRKAIRTSTGTNTGPYSIAVADFNQDGVPDLATANFMSGTATILLGIGDGHFENAIDAGLTGVFSYGTIAGDLDGDGKPDVATANAVDDNVTVLISTAH